MSRDAATHPPDLSSPVAIFNAANPYLHNPHLPGAPFRLEAPGPDAVLLFHGFTATCSEVARLGQVLNEHGYTAVGPLLPGHGTTPAELNRTRWQSWTTAAEDAYQDLTRRCRRVIVGGESNGALLALYLAAMHPEAAAVLAYAPALRARLTTPERLALHLLAPFNVMFPKSDLARDTVWQGYTVNPLKGVLQHMQLQKVVTALLPRICQPILIIQGRQDHTIDPRSAELVYAQVSSPRKELHWLEESGHCVLLDGQHAVAERLTLDFLDRLGVANP